MNTSPAAANSNSALFAEARHQNDQQVERLLRLREVLYRVGCGRSTLYRMIADGEFPPSIALGERSVAWSESSVNSFIQGRIAASAQQRAA